MAYKLLFTKQARKQLESLDRSDVMPILKWLDKNVHNCHDPRSHGKALTGELKGYWRYRIGKYRVICLIQDDELIVLAIEIGKRNSVYN